MRSLINVASTFFSLAKSCRIRSLAMKKKTHLQFWLKNIFSSWHSLLLRLQHFTSLVPGDGFGGVTSSVQMKVTVEDVVLVEPDQRAARVR